MAEYNVSVEKIKQGIQYLEEEFTNPLIKVGTQLIDQYKDLNTVLRSETIDNIIKEQQNKLDELQAELKRISEKAQSAMDDACRPGNPRDTSVEEIKELFLSLM